MQRVQVLALFGIGLAGILSAVYLGGTAKLEKAVSTNQSLLAMLAAVSFLRLVTLPQSAADEMDPRGPGALRRTLLGDQHTRKAIPGMSSLATGMMKKKIEQWKSCLHPYRQPR